MRRCPHCRQEMPDQSDHDRARDHFLALGFVVYVNRDGWEIDTPLGSTTKATSQDFVDYARELGME